MCKARRCDALTDQPFRATRSEHEFKRSSNSIEQAKIMADYDARRPVVKDGLEYWETQPATLDGVLGTLYDKHRPSLMVAQGGLAMGYVFVAVVLLCSS